MTKMKLAPIEASVIIKMAIKASTNPCDPNEDVIYKAMISECPTVEVVDVEDFLFQQMKEIQTDPMISKRQDLKKIGLVVAQILDAHLKENGYQIIKKV